MSRRSITRIVFRVWVGASALLLMMPVLSESGILELLGLETLPAYVRNDPMRLYRVVGLLTFSIALAVVALNVRLRLVRMPVVLLFFAGLAFWLWVCAHRIQLDGVWTALGIFAFSAITIGIPIILAILLLTVFRVDVPTDTSPERASAI